MTGTAVVIGCGGTIGGAWVVAALHALADQTGLDPRDADVLQGTSAGAELVTMLGSGIGVDELVAMQRGTATDSRLRAHVAATPSGIPPVPRLPLLAPALLRRRSGHAALTGMAPTGRGDASWLQRLADGMGATGGGEWLPHGGARMVAYDVRSGDRVAFGAPGGPTVSVGEALRASWAIPGWMPPVAVDGRLFVDGGAASTASVDLVSAADAHTVYVIAPMASAVGERVPGVGGAVEDRLLRRPMSAGLAAEIETARARGQTVIPILPTTQDLRGLGANFMRRSHRVDAFGSSMRTAPHTVRAALSRSGVGA
ncbi:patatin-like phospholipase family protein [Gordonia soli]|uniref:PNPLA domain-containing protein n=1 Tax=Gordonia soli NBRC 108243 TaxID=1223545 RepID=M0QQ77_9ACTN|nr:patatin-like phospholipase family protein [Gordonia soli]GAC70549.1 hypothetical protein GS4_36_00350 [Gordonia soli NBRC 108243]